MKHDQKNFSMQRFFFFADLLPDVVELHFSSDSFTIQK